MQANDLVSRLGKKSMSQRCVALVMHVILCSYTVCMWARQKCDLSAVYECMRVRAFVPPVNATLVNNGQWLGG